jgi:hypothetical protein
MGQGCFRLLFAMAVGLVVLACTGTAAATQSCASRLLADWEDGRIDQTYPVACYRQALANLPEDVRVYSTAQTDIMRALQARLGTAAAASTKPQHEDAGVSPLVVVAITAGILIGAGSVAAAVR